MGFSVLLAKPAVKYPVSPNGDVGVPLGLLYLASYVRQHNPSTEVEFRDYRLQKSKGIERNLKTDLQCADVVGAGGSTTEIPDSIEIFRAAKQQGKITIAGGIFPSTNPEYLLKTGLVDYVVRGEGEEAFSELVAALQQGKDAKHVDGISYLDNGALVNNPKRRGLDLQRLPLPAYDLAPMKEYAKIATGSIYSARGCSMSCDFCTVSKHWQNSYRPRPVASVIKEMRMLADYGFERIHFKDESMLHHQERARELFGAIRDAGIGVKIKGKARLDELDDDILALLQSAGVDMIHVGIESISRRSLVDMHKGLTISDIRGNLEKILQHGIGVNPVFMFSWLGETPEDLRMNAAFIEDFGRNPHVVTYMSFITPHPGTTLHTDAARKGLVVMTDDLDRYSHKQPVAFPASLGANGLELIVSTYHQLAKTLGMEHVNPPIEPNYLEQIKLRVAA